MKRIRTLTSILLAIVLLLIPSAVLADDPNGGVDVGIGIVSDGDVNVDIGINAGGDTNVSINNDELATKGDVAVATQGTVRHEEYVCGGSRMAIKDIYRILEMIYGRQVLLADGLALEIILSKEQAEDQVGWLSRLTAYTYGQDSRLAYQESYDNYLNAKVDDLTEIANHQVTALMEQTQRLEQEQIAMRADYNCKLLGVSISALIIIVVLGIVAHRAKRRA